MRLLIAKIGVWLNLIASGVNIYLGLKFNHDGPYMMAALHSLVGLIGVYVVGQLELRQEEEKKK